MKTALWVLGALLAIDALELSYFFIFRASYYFPDRYEDAYAAGAYGGIVAIILMIAFALVLAEHLKPRGPDDRD